MTGGPRQPTFSEIGRSEAGRGRSERSSARGRETVAGKAAARTDSSSSSSSSSKMDLQAVDPRVVVDVVVPAPSVALSMC